MVFIINKLEEPSFPAKNKQNAASWKEVYKTRNSGEFAVWVMCYNGQAVQLK